MTFRLLSLRPLTALLALALLTLGTVRAADPKDGKESAPDPKLAKELATYPLVEFRVLKASVETYLHKKVAYEGFFLDFTATFPQYVEDSGFKANKYFWLAVQDVMVPVMVRKTADLNEQIGNLKQFSKVRIYGKGGKFRQEPQFNMLPRYYIELEHLEVITAKPGETPPVGGTTATGDTRGEGRTRPLSGGR